MKTIGIPKSDYSTKKRWEPYLKWIFPCSINIIDVDPGFGLVKNLPDVDLLLFDGGEDVHPVLYSGTFHKTIHTNIGRDWNEKLIFEHYIKTPTLFAGICRGSQFLNIMCGGNLWADLPSENKEHHYYHQAVILPGTTLAEQLDVKPRKSEEIDITVNSTHHQAVKDLGHNLQTVLVEPETNVIEGFESLDGKIKAVQSHPEYGDNPYKMREEIANWLFRIETNHEEEQRNA